MKSLNLSNVREWYIIIGINQEGPFSLLDLKNDPRFSPDTWVWKRGFSKWMQARHVFELQFLFKDPPKGKPLDELHSDKKITPALERGDATLTLSYDPNLFILWFLLILIILFYTFYQLYK